METRIVTFDELPGIELVITRDPHDAGPGLPPGWVRLSFWDVAVRDNPEAIPGDGLLATAGHAGPGPL